MFNQENTAIDFAKLNNQFIVDQVALDFSVDSARFTDMSERQKIKLQSLQAAMQAAASIAAKPEMQPPLPKPFALPRAEYAEVFKPGTPPPPMKAVAQQTNLFAAGLSGALSGAEMGMSISSSFGSSSGGGPGGSSSTSLFSGGVTVGPGQVSLGPTPVTLPGSYGSIT